MSRHNSGPLPRDWKILICYNGFTSAPTILHHSTPLQILALAKDQLETDLVKEVSMTALHSRDLDKDSISFFLITWLTW